MMAPSYIAEARRRVGPKRERIEPIIERLTAEHPDAGIALKYRSDLELLVSVMLSAQTTDVNVNRVTERLFEKYRRPEDYLAVPLSELEDDIRPTGFFRQKAKAVRGTMQLLVADYDGRVPDRMEDLLRLPGAVLMLGERLGSIPGGLLAAARLSDATGVRLAWVPRRAGERAV